MEYKNTFEKYFEFLSSYNLLSKKYSSDWEPEICILNIQKNKNNGSNFLSNFIDKTKTKISKTENTTSNIISPTLYLFFYLEILELLQKKNNIEIISNYIEELNSNSNCSNSRISNNNNNSNSNNNNIDLVASKDKANNELSFKAKNKSQLKNNTNTSKLDNNNFLSNIFHNKSISKESMSVAKDKNNESKIFNSRVNEKNNTIESNSGINNSNTSNNNNNTNNSSKKKPLHDSKFKEKVFFYLTDIYMKMFE